MNGLSDNTKSWFKAIMMVAVIGMLFYVDATYAASSDCTSSSGDNKDALGGIADNIIKSFGSVVKLITGMSFVAGFGFVLGSIFKFKAHKDNPTQIPIGTPIALLFIGASMIFLPQILNVTGHTIFADDSAQVGGVKGVCDFGFKTTPSGGS